MSLAKKLNLKDGMRLRVVGKPKGLDLGDVATTTSAKGDGVLLFARTMKDAEAAWSPFLEAAREDRLAWIAYPKAGQLDTDLNRDILWQRLLREDVHGVRQVALDDVWSAMRFRPK